MCIDWLKFDAFSDIDNVVDDFKMQIFDISAFNNSSPTYLTPQATRGRPGGNCLRNFKACQSNIRATLNTNYMEAQAQKLSVSP